MLWKTLSSILAAESTSLPREVIEEVKTVQRANLSEDEQKQELRVIAHRYQIQEEVIISHFFKSIPVEAKPGAHMGPLSEGESLDQDSVGEMASVAELSSADSRLEATTVRKITQTPGNKCFNAPRDPTSNSVRRSEAIEISRNEVMYYPQLMKQTTTLSRCVECGESFAATQGQSMCSRCVY